MAGEDSAAAEPKPGQSSAGQEQGQIENQATTRRMEREGQQENEAAPSKPLPPKPLPPRPLPLPPRPLPLPFENTPKWQPSPQAQPSHFGPLPAQQVLEPTKHERPHYPRWHVVKIIFGLLSLVVSVVIFGVGIALGFLNAPYNFDDFTPADVELGTSGAAAGLAILVTTIEFLTICLSKQRRGMHPGALVAFHLLIWLIALAAVVITALFNSEYSYYFYDYPSYSSYSSYMQTDLALQTSVYEQVLLGFDCTLLFIHFVLFIGACVETNRFELARKKTLVIRVPVYGGLQPGAQGVQYPPHLMSQVPPHFGQGAGPVSPQTAPLYGRYYAPAPAPPPMAWTASQKQAHYGFLQGYYASLNPPAITVNPPAQNLPPGPPAPAAGSGSRSRRSQGQAQPQPQPQSPSPIQPPASQQEP